MGGADMAKRDREIAGEGDVEAGQDELAQLCLGLIEGERSDGEAEAAAGVRSFGRGVALDSARDPLVVGLAAIRREDAASGVDDAAGPMKDEVAGGAPRSSFCALASG
jgi:hypothetical protein